MITAIDFKTAQRLLKDRHDIFSLKIGAALYSYDGYDFCGVYAGENILIGRYYNDFIIRTDECLTDETAEELLLFLTIWGWGEVLCGFETGKRLARLDGMDYTENVLLKFSSGLIPENETTPYFDDLKENPLLDTVFPIIKDGFPDVVYEDWYTDISHKVRHKISKVYVYGGATATVMAETEKAAFVSLLAVKKELRGRGNAKSLIRSLGIHFEDQKKEMSLLCRDELVPFYKKAGFYEAGRVISFSAVNHRLSERPQNAYIPAEC